MALRVTLNLSPTSGPFGTSVHISGTRFDSNSDVIITFGYSEQASSTDNNGEFYDNFDVPISDNPDLILLRLVTDLIQIQQHLQ